MGQVLKFPTTDVLESVYDEYVELYKDITSISIDDLEQKDKDLKVWVARKNGLCIPLFLEYCKKIEDEATRLFNQQHVLPAPYTIK